MRSSEFVLTIIILFLSKTALPMTTKHDTKHTWKIEWLFLVFKIFKAGDTNQKAKKNCLYHFQLFGRLDHRAKAYLYKRIDNLARRDHCRKLQDRDRFVIFFHFRPAKHSLFTKIIWQIMWHFFMKRKRGTWSVIEKLFLNCMHVTFLGRTYVEVLLLGRYSASLCWWSPASIWLCIPDTRWTSLQWCQIEWW